MTKKEEKAARWSTKWFSGEIPNSENSQLGDYKNLFTG